MHQKHKKRRSPRPRLRIWRNYLKEPLPENYLRLIPHGLNSGKAKASIFSIGQGFIDSSAPLEYVAAVVPEARVMGARICRVKAIPVTRREIVKNS